LGLRVYGILIIAFGVGVFASHRRWALHLLGGLLVGIGVVGMLTPPMYLRGTGNVSSDLPHIVLTGVIVAFILAVVAVGASLYGRRWRLYSYATILTLLVSGALTGIAGSRLAAGRPTPWLGLAERINIGAYLLWVVALAIMLWRARETATPTESRILTNQELLIS
jgi:NO-binding membrane sensor protein with MHYT domain